MDRPYVHKTRFYEALQVPGADAGGHVGAQPGTDRADARAQPGTHALPAPATPECLS